MGETKVNRQWILTALVYLSVIIMALSLACSPGPAQPPTTPKPTTSPSPTPTSTPKPAALKYILKVTVSPPEGGSVSNTGGSYDTGASVEINAKPATGYDFIGWSGDATGISTSITVKMDSDKTLTATFRKVTQEFILAVAVSPASGGSVNITSGKYLPGTQVELKATPASGFQFDSWAGDASSNSPTIQITMNSDKKITANFKSSITYVLRVTVNPIDAGVVAIRGDVTGSVGLGVTSSPFFTTSNGASVTLTATAAPGYEFTGWSGDGIGTAGTISLTMSSDKNVTANFKSGTQRIELTLPPGQKESSWVVFTRTLRNGEKVSGTILVTGQYDVQDRSQNWTMIVTDASGNQIYQLVGNWFGASPRGFSFNALADSEYKIKLSHGSSNSKALQLDISPSGWKQTEMATS